jgi:flagellar biosynthesis protein FlhG
MNTEMSAQTIIAFGGGKGGTGKSFVSANIGTYLALQGNSVLMIDADIGGANLHSFFGLRRPKATLTNFFENKIPLEHIATETELPNLCLIPGDIKTLNSNNINFTEKIKLFKHIKTIKVEFVLLDLGAGTHFNTLDTFLLADKKVMVITPEKIAIENMYHFIKNVLFRKAERFHAENGMKSFFSNTYKNRKTLGLGSIKDLLDYLIENSLKGKNFAAELDNLGIFLILNKTSNRQDSELGFSIRSILFKYLGIRTIYAGSIEDDAHILKCINDGDVFMQKYSTMKSAKEIERVSVNLLNDKQQKIRELQNG